MGWNVVPETAMLPGEESSRLPDGMGSFSRRATRERLRGQSLLEFLRRYAHGGSLIPSQLGSAFTEDQDELSLGMPSCKPEKPDAFGTVGASGFLLWLCRNLSHR